ncbi:hypothetical protein JL720_1885 [Aureococcus anophagefferens]|nr:hypothetical protein JL720_1885 [Aureococcus anophagefferens]
MMTPMGEKVRAPKQGGLEVGATVATLLLLVATSVWTFHVQKMPNFQIKLDVAWTITDLGQTVGGGSYVLVRKYGVWKLSCQLWKHGGRALGALMYALSCRFHALTFLGRAAFVDVACIIIFVAVGRFAGRVEVKPFVYESTPEMHFSLNFAGRPARGVLAYCLTVIVGQALTHGVLVDRTFDGVPPRRPSSTFLFQLAHFFVVVAPLARVACLGAACVVPSRVARVVLRGVVDVVSIFVAADAFLLALGVTIVDLRSMLYEFTNQQLPVSLEDSLTVDIHAKTAWFFALFALVVGESVRPASSSSWRRSGATAGAARRKTKRAE